MSFGSGGGDYDDYPFLTPRTYDLPELPWEIIAGRLEAITISIVRFDARLETSGPHCHGKADGSERLAIG